MKRKPQMDWLLMAQLRSNLHKANRAAIIEQHIKALAANGYTFAFQMEDDDTEVEFTRSAELN